MTDKAVFAEVPFVDIPNQSSLFLSYLGLTPEALRYYQRPPTVQAVVDFARTGLGPSPFPRREVCAILRRQNENFGSDSRCLQHVEDLALPNCFAVVTGQQAGLFAGPLYTVYKAFTAIRLTEELRARGVAAVPVFWLDTDDHDLAEVTRSTVVAADSSIHVMDYRQLLFDGVSESTRPVGSIPLPPTIRQAVEDYVSRLPGTDWKEQTRARLASAYSPQTGFADAFGRLMADLFAGHGLVLFDPRDQDAKRLAAPLFQTALKEAQEINSELSARSRALEAAGFHNQVSILENSTLLFYLNEGRRMALVAKKDDFTLKGTELRLSLDKLRQEVAATPESFSPNVLLRPLVQDTLFPTICYVGGPGEIAYFAQAEPLYRRFGRPMPVIWPRVSLTLLEAETAAAMTRYGLSLADCFLGRERVLGRMLESLGNDDAVGTLTSLQEQLTRAFEDLRPIMAAAEASLGPATDTARSKILHHLAGMRAKFVQSEGRQNSELLKKAELLLNSCCPNRNLQERELGICQFLSRYGPGVMETIYSFMRLDRFIHRVLVLSP